MAQRSTAMAESQEQQQRAPEPAARDRVLVAGLGRAGLDYACAFAMHPNAEIVGFVEPRGDLRRFVRGIGFQAPMEASIHRWLDKRPADTLVVCSPPAEAAELVEKGVQSGLAVLVHGLAAMPRAVTDRIEAALAVSGRPIGAGAAVMFEPTFARARRTGALSADHVQMVRASASVSRVFSPLVQPGRDVIDFLLADLLLLLDASFGPVQSVFARAQKLYGDWYDEAQVDARFANGLTAKIEVSWSVPDYPGTAIVIEGSGQEGRIIVSDDALEMDMASLQGRVVASSEPSNAKFEGGDSPAVVEGWLRLLRGDNSAADALSAPRALRVARALDAVRRSIAGEGGEVGVSL